MVSTCLPIYAYTDSSLNFNSATSNNAFGNLLDWTGVIFKNVDNSGIFDMKGSLAVGGNVTTSGGFTISNPQNTNIDDVAFLVNGNAKIKGYGSVTGKTVLGSSDGNNYRLSNITSSETTNGEYAVADSSQYFSDAKNTAYAVKSAIDKLSANGECQVANGVYTFVGDSNKDVLVYNVEDSVINSYRFDFNISDKQTVIVNLTAQDTIKMSYGAFCINGSMEQDDLSKYSRNIIINVVNASKLEMNHCDMYGTLVAPKTDLIGKGGDVCGTVILNNLDASNGFELHTGNSGFVPTISTSSPEHQEPTISEDGEKVAIRIDMPRKMAVAFADGSVYYGGETKEVVVGQEYPFQMCSVNWDNGVYDENGNGLRGTVVYRMIAVHRDNFIERARSARENPDRYTVKGIDIIDNEEKTIIINCDAADTHLETDVNNFFVAYRFHFSKGDYNKKTGIEGVINTPLESLSVNLPVGSTITCNAYNSNEMIATDNVFITVNSGEGIYEDEHLTSVNDYYWNN